MPVLLDGPLTRLDHDIVVDNKTGPNPWVRNSNVAGSYDNVKAGPRAIIRESENLYKMWWEGVRSGTEPDITNEVGYATSTNGIDWIKYAGNPVLSPTPGSWEKGEVAPTAVVWDPIGSRYIMYYHGGNNSGPRKIGIATSPDGITWTKYAGNPVLIEGAAGAHDQSGVADAKVVRLSATSWVMLYKGFNQPTEGPHRTLRATSTDGFTWTKTSNTAVLNIGPTGAFDDYGAYGTTTPYIDGDGRWHIWYCGETTPFAQKLGYAYSDDLGVTWTKGVNNPVLGPNPDTTAPDAGNTGDTLEATNDGDKLLVSFGSVVFSNYTGTGGVPFRGICASYLPLKRVSIPATRGRFFLVGDRVELSPSVGILNDLVFTIVARIRVYREDEWREIYTEEIGSQRNSFFRIGQTGVLAARYNANADGSQQVNLSSTGRYDDNLWHNVAFRRNNTSSFDLIADGAVLASSTNNPGATSDALGFVPTYGDWAANYSLGTREAIRGTIGRIAVWDTAALSTAEITAFLNNGTIPAGGQPRWWHDPGGGSPEPDLSPNGNTGTVTGTTVVNADRVAGVTPVVATRRRRPRMLI